MTIPADISTGLTALQNQLAAAGNLQNASGPTIVALQLNAESFLGDVDAALDAAAGSLDTFMAPTDPQAIISGFLGLVGNATDQYTLCNIEGYVGRAVKNLDQLV
jgi:hypothetical protein